MDNVNPLLQTLRLPGETVRLPSRAKLYTTEEVAQSVIDSGGELHVYPMTTYEEILMKTPDLLFSGHAIVQTFSRCIPEIVDPFRLFAKDVDFLLVALRKATYGADIDLKFNHGCTNSKEHNYVVNTQEFMSKAREIDQSMSITGIAHKLKNGQVANIRPFLLSNVVAASQRASSQTNIGDQTDLEFAELLRTTVIEGLAPAIVDVDGVTDLDFIKEWLDNLPTTWVTELSQAVDKIGMFGIEFQTKITCKDCGEELDVLVPLNPQSFFTTPSELEIPN